MKASALEFRLRVVIIVGIVCLGYWAPWIDYLRIGRRINFIEWSALELSHLGLLNFTIATPTVIIAGALIAALAVVMRVWGTAYLGTFTVFHGNMQAGAVMASGPYRYVRNPLYIGTWSMATAMAFMMTPTGALFTVVLMSIFLLRLILGEEAFLTAQMGQPYLEYKQAIPRLFPRLRSPLPASKAQPDWLRAVCGELNAIGIFITLAAVSWTYNHELMLRCVLVSFGASLVARALVRPASSQPA
jgi:protein-S-isoprenylcysteine O-methyltransferase Ste14